MPVQDMGPILGEVMKGSYKYVNDNTDDDCDNEDDHDHGNDHGNGNDNDEHDHCYKDIVIYVLTI